MYDFWESAGPKAVSEKPALRLNVIAAGYMQFCYRCPEVNSAMVGVLRNTAAVSWLVVVAMVLRTVLFSRSDLPALASALILLLLSATGLAAYILWGRWRAWQRHGTPIIQASRRRAMLRSLKRTHPDFPARLARCKIETLPWWWAFGSFGKWIDRPMLRYLRGVGAIMAWLIPAILSWMSWYKGANPHQGFDITAVACCIFETAIGGYFWLAVRNAGASWQGAEGRSGSTLALAILADDFARFQKRGGFDSV